MKLNDYVEVVHDGNIGLSLAGERGTIVGPGENGYDWTVRFEFPVEVGNDRAFQMWFNTDELRVVEEG